MPRNWANAWRVGCGDDRRNARKRIAVGANRPPVSWVPMAEQFARWPNFLVAKLFVPCNFKSLEITMAYEARKSGNR